MGRLETTQESNPMTPYEPITKADLWRDLIRPLLCWAVVLGLIVWLTWLVHHR